MKFDLVFFDLDGTLVDSGPDIASSLNWALRREGEPVLPEARIVAAIGSGVSMLLDRTIGAGHPKRAQIHAGLTGHYSEHLLERTTLYPGVRETLEAIAAPRVMVTNKPESMTHKLLAGLKMAHLFAAVYGGEGRLPRKPDPSAVLESLDRFKAAKARAILVGDSGVDVATAKAAGIRSCAVTYGYSMPEDLEGADYRIARFDELGAILRG